MKNSPVVKAIKYIAYAVGAAVALVLLLVLTLPLWLGPVVKPAVRVAVPRFTGTTFELGHLYLNPYTGRLEVGGLVVGNPKGYDEPVALSLSNLVFDAAMTTLCDEYVHVEEISIDGVFVSYLGGGEHDVDNFTQIQYNLAGSKEKFEESKRKSELKKAEAEAAEEVEETVAEFAMRKFVIDRLTIRNVRIKYGFLTIPVPVDIVLTDIGKDSGGATISEVCEQVWQAILKSTGAVNDSIKALGSFLGDGASKTTDVLGDGAKKTSDVLGKGAKKTLDAVDEGARKTTEAVKKLFNF